MSDIQDRIIETLKRVAQQLSKSGLEREAADLQELAGQVTKPCVVAVVGKVKAGKSAFINALLKEDLAKVGVLETTATINKFSFGYPDNDRPIRCYWRGGGVSSVDRAFLDGLQGHDMETLRRADAIECLEYFLPNPFLQQVTLVDTPGTGAVVEQHQNRTAEYMQLYGQLRARHDEETQRIGREADAVIYLVGPVAMGTDSSFLDEFLKATRRDSRPLNAVGVMAKIDLFPAMLANRNELAGKIARQLKSKLNTVIPVSSAIRRTLDSRFKDDPGRMPLLQERLGEIPAPRLEMLLDSDEFFLNKEFVDCPVSCSERRDLKGDIDWAVFKAIARRAVGKNLTPDAVLNELDDVSGFAALYRTLNKHFFERGHILRCYRIVEDARKLLRQLKIERLPQIRKSEIEGENKLARFKDFIANAGGDPALAQELTELLVAHLCVTGRARALATLIDTLDGGLRECYDELIEFNADFEALQVMEEGADSFTADELDELRPLFGLYGIDPEKQIQSANLNTDYVSARQLAWHSNEFKAPPGTVRHVVAVRAYARYGSILKTIANRQRAGAT
jgi:hypothetical protein